ncbi:hypothetical protein RF11_00533 [Thelohanellus kitauei]|uniref:Integrase zinc-binding domain-containing protein n=1 Tax=Thelohanellus kitauei TaxID=669202 RepID=A0A0C2N556_THEKT|nr:hypothetical protein RF11_00533 [Thelohanellus kitauei]
MKRRIVSHHVYHSSVLEKSHESHLGISKTKSWGKLYLWCPSFDADIQKLALYSRRCQLHKRKNPPKESDRDKDYVPSADVSIEERDCRENPEEYWRAYKKEKNLTLLYEAPNLHYSSTLDTIKSNQASIPEMEECHTVEPKSRKQMAPARSKYLRVLPQERHRDHLFAKFLLDFIGIKNMGYLIGTPGHLE